MINFSKREGEIIKIIGRCKKLTVKEICEKLFDGRDDKPFDAEISVGNTIRRIIEKCEHYKLDWTLRRQRVNNKMFINKEDL